MSAPWWTKYIGIPFAELGRTRSGADCWGLARMVYAEELGLHLPAWSSHSALRDVDRVEMEVKEAHTYFDKVEEPQPFAMAYFFSALSVAHVGILIDDERMLHTLKGKDACIEPWSSQVHLLKGFYLPNDKGRRPT